MEPPCAAHRGPGDARTAGWGTRGPGAVGAGMGESAALRKRCSPTYSRPRGKPRIQRSLASTCRASGVRGNRDAGEGEKKGGRETRGPGSGGRRAGGTIRYANPSARRCRERPGVAGRNLQNLPALGSQPTPPPPAPFSPSHSYRPPGCGWAAGPSVCWSCCSPAPRWGSCTRAPGTRRASGHLLRCGRPCRAPPDQNCQT